MKTIISVLIATGQLLSTAAVATTNTRIPGALRGYHLPVVASTAQVAPPSRRIVIAGARDPEGTGSILSA